MQQIHSPTLSCRHTFPLSMARPWIVTLSSIAVIVGTKYRNILQTVRKSHKNVQDRRVSGFTTNSCHSLSYCTYILESNRLTKIHKTKQKLFEIWNIFLAFAIKFLHFSFSYFLDHFWEDEVSTQSDGFTRWRANIHFPLGWKSIQCKVLQRLKQLAKDVGYLAREARSLPQHCQKKESMKAPIKCLCKKSTETAGQNIL